MTSFRSALLAGVAGVLAVSGFMTAANAATYNVSVYQNSVACDGAGACANATTSTAPTFTNSTFNTLVATGTYTSATGNLAFNLPQGGTDTIGGFLATGNATGTYTPVSGNTNLTLSTAGSGTQSAFFFSGGVLNPVGDSISVTHDDGFSLYLGSHLEYSSASPTAPKTDNFLVPAADIAAFGSAFEIVYVASNGLPEQLNFTVSPVPLPATVWLFGAGLGGLALMRRRKAKPVQAA